MMEDIQFKDFCRAHFNEAMQDAEYTIKDTVKQKGKLDARMDLDKVKSLAALSAIESAFATYDSSRGGKLSSYLSLLVRRDVQTELGKEWTEVKKFDVIKTKRKARQTAEEKAEEAKKGKIVEVEVSGIMPGVKGTGISDELFEPASFMDIEGASKGKEMLWRKVKKKLQQLSPVDQTVIRYWMYEEQDDLAYERDGEKPQRTYVQRVLDELGLPASSANAITIRRFKAVKKLRAMMSGENTDYHDMYVPGSSAQWGYESNSNTVIKIYSDEEYESMGDAFKKRFK